ncbi:MAG: 23S rRNA (adenine(2030)-N(6))-methyltransferase RlmJ [Paracoccus denitrificans]|nr:MAG: 23S rRNA (adenine(2030)-N(6))-methyltransferase RlmJ [Paracoccus denitrificans]PZO85948.1 MAG: 23S rRNA (adenine(2030)-N(6))-methyltransferase RlmJ [Paracoccus denitrificans]
MLSYQHGFHAGNLADLHKHALLSVALWHMTQKPKPMTYMETHAGRGLYDLSGAQSAKTGEAEAGVTRALAEGWFAPNHPLVEAIEAVRNEFGPAAYPGSPLIARHFLREDDRATLAELHPAENAALSDTTAFARVEMRDGFEMANALIPPTPRRGLLMIDPSYEVKDDYDRIPPLVAKLAKKWNVGVIMVWYPILTDARQALMAHRLRVDHPDALVSEVRFPPARSGHGMVGSGMFVINPPYGLEEEAKSLAALYKELGR